MQRWKRDLIWLKIPVYKGGQEVFLLLSPGVLVCIRQTKQGRWVGLSVSINNSTLAPSIAKVDHAAR